MKPRRNIAFILTLIFLFTFVGCGNSDEVESDNREIVNTENIVEKVETINVWLNDYPEYSKEEVQQVIEKGLSYSFEKYQLYTILENYMSFPYGIRQTIENAIGAFRLNVYTDKHGNANRYFENYEEENLQNIQAIMDLYELTPETFLDKSYAISSTTLDSLVMNNPKMDMSIYKTPEDGDAFLPMYETFGSTTLADANGVTFEGVKDIENVEGVELVARTIKVTNTSDSYRYIENVNDFDFSQIEGYNQNLDKRDMIESADTIGTNGKYWLAPGEVTYYRMDFTGLSESSFNSHYSYCVYEADENGNPIGSGEVVAFICSNQTVERTLDTATISGTIYDEDGFVVPFVPVSIAGMDFEGNTRSRAIVYTSIDGTFNIEVPVFKYSTDGAYARQAIMVNENINYRNSNYGSAYAIAMPTTSGEVLNYNLVLSKMENTDYLTYEISSSTDFNYQTYWSDISNGICATVAFHDEDADNSQVKLHVFDTEGNLIFDYLTGEQVPYVDVSNDGQLVATTVVKGNEQYATIFDLTGQIVFEQKGIGRVRSIQISPDNAYVVYGSDEGPVVMAEVSTGNVIWSYNEQNQVRQIKFDTDGQTIFIGSENGVRAIKSENGESIWLTYTESWSFDLIVGTDKIYTDSKASGGNANNILCLNKTDGSTIWSYAVASRCCRMQLSPDETMLFWGNDTGARDVECYMLDAQTGYPIWMEDIYGQAAWFTSDSNYVAIKGYGGLFVYDRDGNQRAFIECPSNSKMSYFVYISDDLNTILNVAGNQDVTYNSGMLYVIHKK